MLARSQGKTLILVTVCIACFAVGFGGAALVRRLPDAVVDGGAPTSEKTPPRSGGRPSAQVLRAAEKHFQAGFRLLQGEQLSEALEEFKTATKIDVTDPRPHHGLGQVYQKMVLVERAEAAYRKALEIDPSFDHSKKKLATLVYERGRYEEATRLLKELRTKSPSDTFVWAELALNALALGRPREAISLLEEYNAARGRQAWGLTHLGKAHEAAGDPVKAEAAYREAIATDPRFAAACYALGQLLAARGDEAESARQLKTYEQLRNLETRAHELRMALLRDASNVDTLMSLAQVRVRLGKAAEALPLIDRARRLQPANASIQTIYEKVEQTVAAQKRRN